jgi:hypothetical protein
MTTCCRSLSKSKATLPSMKSFTDEMVRCISKTNPILRLYARTFFDDARSSVVTSPTFSEWASIS